jgi:hypothetical protein
MYIGNTVQNQGYAPQIAFFSGNASTTAFTLPSPVATTAQLIVSVANVVQNPGSAYTVSGNTITFSSAPPTGTNNIWVEYTSLITQVIAPSPGTVGAAQLPQSQILTAVQQPTGSIVQVVNSYYQSSTSTTGTSFVSTSYSVSITPQFSTSKIFLLMTCYGAAVLASTNLYVQLWRGGSNIIPNAKNWIEIENPSSNAIALPVTQSFFEAPNSTSSLTYTIYIASSNSNAVYLMNNGPGYGYLNLTAQEIR